MTQIPIYLKGNGPITRAIRELDARTRSLYPAPAPGMQTTRTSTGTVHVPRSSQLSNRQARSVGAVWQ
jgi:hypothetical protein